MVTGTSGLGISQSGLLVLKLKLKYSLGSKTRSSRMSMLRCMGVSVPNVNVAIVTGIMFAS